MKIPLRQLDRHLSGGVAKIYLVAGDEPLPAGLTPIYPTTAGVGQATLRKLIAQALADGLRERRFSTLTRPVNEDDRRVAVPPQFPALAV